MRFLVSGRHGPVDLAEVERNLAVARDTLEYVRDRAAAGVVLAAYAKRGGGRVLVVEVENEAAVEELIARFPGPDDMQWEHVELIDFVGSLEAFVSSQARA